MDDFTISNLNDSKNEYSALLIGKITPSIMKGIYSIYNEAVKLCKENDEHEKYLMTFQNFLGRITKWNQDIIENETERIVSESGCSYLEDLLTCVHVAQLKVLTCIRVGQKQKKVEIDIPSLSDFIHKIYIDVARKVYKNVYLFEANISSLTRQKYLRELEVIVKESILNVIRANMPMEKILKSYLDETNEEEVCETVEEVKEQLVEQPKEEITPTPESIVQQSLSQDQQGENTEKEMDSRETKTIPDVGGNIKIVKTDNDSDTHSVNSFTQQYEEKQTIPSTHTTSPMHTTSSTPTIIKINNDESPNVTNEVSKEFESLSFKNTDSVKDYDTTQTVTKLDDFNERNINAPKDISTLEEISEKNWEMRRNEYDDPNYDDDSDDEKIQIFDESTPLEIDDLPLSLENSKPIKLNTDDDLLGEIETLV